MAETTFELDAFKKRMLGVIETLKRDFSGLRTGRASGAILDPIVVDIYGQKMPLNQVGTVSVPEPRMISVQVWDKSAVSAVDKAIRAEQAGMERQAGSPENIEAITAFIEKRPANFRDL